MNADPLTDISALPRARFRQRLLPILLLAAAPARGQILWINEFHYDNTGVDSQEFVEVIAPSSLADLTNIRLTLYNGGDGTPYGASAGPR